jgi:purine-cytosine permease-like protein
MRRLVRRLARVSSHRLLQGAAVLTILALGLMVWSMMQPTPLPVMLAMTVGQLIGTIAFGLYGIVIVKDLRRARRERRASAERIESDEREVTS